MGDSKLMRGYHFTDDGSEAEGGQMTCLHPHSSLVMELVFASSQTNPRAL